MPVKRCLKPHLLTNFLLEAFNLQPLDFRDGSACLTNQVVMMRTFGLDLITPLSICRRDVFDQATLFEHFKSPEDGDFPDAFRFQRFIDIVLTDMAVGRQQKIKDHQPLGRTMQIMAPQVFLEYLPDPGRIPSRPAIQLGKRINSFEVIIEISFQLHQRTAFLSTR